MSFSNVGIAFEDLPQRSGVPRTPLAERYATLIAGLAFTWVIVPGLAFQVVGWWRELPFFVVSLAGVATLAVCAAATFYCLRLARSRNFALREHDLIYRTGVFWRSETVQPLKRVQHVELTRGPLEKRMALASLAVYSAGSGSATFTIPGLEYTDAERLRDYLLEPAGEGAGAADG